MPFDRVTPENRQCLTPAFLHLVEILSRGCQGLVVAEFKDSRVVAVWSQGSRSNFMETVNENNAEYPYLFKTLRGAEQRLALQRSSDPEREWDLAWWTNEDFDTTDFQHFWTRFKNVTGHRFPGSTRR